MTTYRQMATFLKRNSPDIRGYVPWAHCDDDEPIHEKQDTKEARNVAVIYDPADTYSGWLDYGSWALSATAHLHRQWRRDARGYPCLAPPDPPHFQDGARFYIQPNKKNTQPARLVEIINGDAIDTERQQRLEPGKGSGTPVWVGL